MRGLGWSRWPLSWLTQHLVRASLAAIEQQRGDLAAAEALWRRRLALGPAAAVAGTRRNLALLLARQPERAAEARAVVGPDDLAHDATLRTTLRDLGVLLDEQ